MFYVLADYEFVHDGHCNGGFISGTHQVGLSLKGCRDHCSALPEAGYFSYSTEGQTCSCYSTVGGCPDDNLYPTHNSYLLTSLFLQNVPDDNAAHDDEDHAYSGS